MTTNEERAYGKTKLGQAVYDFGFSKLTDKWLAKKYAMPIAEVRRIRTKVRKTIRRNQ